MVKTVLPESRDRVNSYFARTQKPGKRTWHLPGVVEELVKLGWLPPWDKSAHSNIHSVDQD